ncbi:pitrilysin family protein [Streptomyces sp. NPDC005483]|uniref:M16 family metallopeptidase n=1 Tax=Streptomyces sp. NPDC005483 TaxID=3154882 RepID=UPI0033BB21DB
MTLPPRPVPGPATAWRFPAPRRTTLRSGLRVLRFDLPGQRLASAVLYLGIPPEAEPADAEGVATIAARTLDEGTTERDGAAFAAEMDLLGAGYSASVNTSGIYLNLDAPARFFGPALGLLAEAVTRPTFAAHEVNRYVQMRLGELAQERATASDLADVERRTACFAPQSRYARPVGGTPETVRGLDRDAVERFYRDHSAPERATLVVAGDFRGTDLETALEGAFGDWSGHAATSTADDGADPAVASPGVVIADRPGAVQSHLSFGLAAPDRRTPGWADLVVAARVLGGGVNSRLSATLREDKGYTYGIYAGLTPLRRGALFTIDAAVQTDATAAAVAEVLAVTEKLRADGPTEAECTEAVDYLTGVHPLRHQTARGIASSAATQRGFGLGDSYLDDFQEALRSVTPASAAAAFRTHVDAARLCLAVAGDACAVAADLSEVVPHEVRVVPA